MKKVIFLDIDGVLVNRASYRLPNSGSADRAIAHPECVAALNAITEATTGAVIVVSSVWRAEGAPEMRGRLKGWGVHGEMIGVTPRLSRTNGRVYRGDEIQKWLDDYTRHEISSFVILDDDSDMKHLLPRLVPTDTEQGLTMKDAQTAIEILELK